MNNKKYDNFIRSMRIRIMVDAIMGRAKRAGIPQRYMRINKDKFLPILSPSYYGDKQKAVAEYVYSKPESLMKKPFVLIDGGTNEERKKAGFAILFRMISCDKEGKYYNASQILHQLQNMSPTYGVTREEFATTIKSHDVIFISDFHPSLIPSYAESGIYIDEILEHRSTYGNPTIISFSLPLSNKKSSVDTSLTDIGQYGYHLVHLSNADKHKDKNIFRIRVGQ